MRFKYRTWLEAHKLYCRFWSWRLPKDLNSMLETWQSIDHRGDKGLTGKDFRAWVYFRKVGKHTFPKSKGGRE